VTRFLAALLLGVLLSHGALAARWFDALPADDPDVVVRRNPPAAQPPTPTPAATSYLYSATVGAASSVIGGIGSVVSGTREALWETAYMFGINSTPVPHREIAEPVPDLVASPAEGTGVPAAQSKPRSKAQAVTQLASNVPTIADVQANAATATTVNAPAEPDAAPKPIDPGLLANFVFDRGDRQPDGTFLVPKSLQRLFEIRTARAVAADLPVTVTLAGRIVPDKHVEADVEASLLGRIEAPQAGLPVLGDIVTEGQVLAYVVPAVGVVDRTQVRREVARLTTEIRVETENLDILKQFTFVPFRDGKIYQSEQRVAGLRREREALLPLLQTQEVLRASTSGVISVSTAILGAIVHPGDKIFQIVNPNRLWVEALAPDPKVAESAQRVATASAITPEGRTLVLTFIGTGLAMEQQSAPILFRIDNPPEGLRVGRPVTVTVQSENRMEHGLPMTRDALTIGPDGVQEVWEQTEPEMFLPHVVRTIDLDAQRVLIVDGVKEGAHVVTQGVRLLAQLQ
jgi:hypothetical protein